MIIARVLGYTVLLFFILAATNGAKRYTKNPTVRWIAKHHRLFAVIALLFAFIHLIVNLSNGNVAPLGLITLILLFLTGFMGAMFKQFKKKKLYVAHRILGPLTFVVALIHLFSNLLS